MKDPIDETEQHLFTNHPAIHSKKKHVLQKIAKAFSYISLVIAFISTGYLLIFNSESNDALKAGIGAIAFFCFTIGFVLYAISSASLPNLRIDTKEDQNTAKNK